MFSVYLPDSDLANSFDATINETDTGMAFDPEENEIFADVTIDTDNAYNTTTGIFTGI